MTSIAKLKDRARKHEQREDWKAAIEAYQKVLEAEEGQDELELGLYNRVGDLYLRLGQTDHAVSYYERAADKYAEAGFYNNAIALCNKALRHRPERPQTYLKLSRLCVEQGFIPDGRRWILDFAERQVRMGNVEEALTGLRNFADTTGDPDVRELLARHLSHQNRPDEAVAQLREAYRTFQNQGNREAAERVAGRALELDPAADLAAESYAEDAADFGSGPVAPPGAGRADPGAMEGGLPGLETHHQDAGPADDAVSLTGLDGLEGLERTETAAFGQAADAPISPEELETFNGDAEDEIEPLPLLGNQEDEEPDEEPEAEPDPLPLLDGEEAGAPSAGPSGRSASAAAGPAKNDSEDAGADEAPAGGAKGGKGKAAAGSGAGAIDELGGFDAVGRRRPASPGAEDPEAAARKYGIEPMDLNMVDLSFGPPGDEEPEDGGDDLDVEAVLNRARELVARALTNEALRELRLLSGADAPPDVYRQALGVANEIVRHEANDVGALQARVEFAAATGDTDLLIGTYLDLADALARLGSETKARAMYERVLDLDPRNEAAREALGAPLEDEDDPVDLEAILQEMEPKPGPKAAPKPGTDPDDASFAALVAQLKSRVVEKGRGEDAGDHYDLGLAFKEMGLIDEAIAEFQKALMAGEERLKVYEELGQCFVMKRQYTVALKIFKRALQMPHQKEAELLGVYYLLGQCHEELGHREEARDAYEKVLSIDASFADVPARVARL